MWSRRSLSASKNKWPGSKASGPNLAGLTWTGNLEPTEAALGLQKVQFEFRYEKMARSLEFMPSGPVTGNGMLLSNGLYLWSFDLTYDPELSRDELRRACEAFLRDDFIRRYIDNLFTFGWTVSEGGGLDSYQGVMTYYQLDILFNGIFDYNALPHAFFDKRGVRLVEDVYSVANIIKSVSLSSIRNSHRPLYETHNDFSLSKDYEPTRQIDTNIDLFRPVLIFSARTVTVPGKVLSKNCCLASRMPRWNSS